MQCLIPNRSVIIYTEWECEKYAKEIFLRKLSGVGEGKESKRWQTMQQPHYMQQHGNTAKATNNWHNKQATNTYMHTHTHHTHTYITFIYRLQSLSAEFCYEIIRNDKYARFLPSHPKPHIHPASLCLPLSLSLYIYIFLCLFLSMCPCLFVWLGQLVSTHTHTHTLKHMRVFW